MDQSANAKSKDRSNDQDEAWTAVAWQFADDVCRFLIASKLSRRGWNRLVGGRGHVYRHILLSSQLQNVLALRFSVEAILPFYCLVFLKEGFSKTRLDDFLLLLQCYRYTWYSHSSRCYNHLLVFLTGAVRNMLIEIIVLAIPWLMAWKLHVTEGQRTAIAACLL